MKNYNIRSWIFIFLVFISFFILANLIDSYSQENFDKKRISVCEHHYKLPIATFKLVKSSLVVHLQDSNVLVFTVLAPNGNNISKDFSMSVEEGDVFEKNANSDEVIIKKKTGGSKHWKIECPIK